MRPSIAAHFLQDTAALGGRRSPRSPASARGPTSPTPARTPTTSPARPNEVLRVAVCGVHGRGMEHIAGLRASSEGRADHHDLRRRPERDRPGARRRSQAATAPSRSTSRTSAGCSTTRTIDAVSIATPNHWHSLAAIWACQAGKDVYVEKPVSHNVSEGRRMVEAARKYDRIVQTGTQCRSHKGIQDAIAFLRSGKLGKIYMAKGLCYKPRGSIGHKADGPVPDGRRLRPLARPGRRAAVQPQPVPLQLALELGLRQRRPRQPGHPPDGPRPLGPGQERVPQGRAWPPAAGSATPTTARRPTPQLVAFEFDDCELQFEVRGLLTNDEQEVKIGDIFYGTEGILAITSYTTGRPTSAPSSRRAPAARAAATTSPTSSRPSRPATASSLNADIEEGHLSSAYCHLGNIAYRLGRKLHINPSTESFVNDSEADAMLTREYRAPFRRAGQGLSRGLDAIPGHGHEDVAMPARLVTGTRCAQSASSGPLRWAVCPSTKTPILRYFS